MRKQEFQQVCNAVGEARLALLLSLPPELKAHASRILDSMSLAIAQPLSKQNPRFAHARFLKACGMESSMIRLSLKALAPKDSEKA